jgi:4-diphosphocytidyl-2C-methyl-D-erythritol kinase
LFYNSFETVLYSTVPELGCLYSSLCDEPFLKVLMSGSGSTIFGVCRSAEEARELGEKLNARLEADVFTVDSEP